MQRKTAATPSTSPKPTAPSSGVLAAIDMGSNSFRLELAQVHGGGDDKYRRVNYFKETVRMGAGLDENGLLTEEATQRGLDCLQRFAQQLGGMHSSHVRAVATQTLREAKNRNAFLQRAQEALGFAVEVISGREEARLIYAGVAHLQPSNEPRLVIDIGGRSTEIILGQGNKALVAESFAVGCVSLSMRFFKGGDITAQGFRAAQVAAGAELEEALQAFSPDRWQRALGSSGTAGAVSQVLQASGVTDGRITPEGLRWCIERCISAGHADRIDLPGLKPDRRAVFPGGVAILYTLSTHFGIQALWPAKGALRQGVVVDLHERLAAAQAQSRAPTGQGAQRGKPKSAEHKAVLDAVLGDVRDASVAELQRRFAIDALQAARVASVARQLFDAAMPKADTETRRELQWACALHECGLMVSHHDHHRHSAYLLANVDAAGFSQSQQRRMADLVLAQRGGLRKVEAQLATSTFAWQVLCLRLAAIKCHARGAVDAGALTLKARDNNAVLGYSKTWLEAHPRTAFLLAEEALAWGRVDALSLLQAVR
jgi:exopolyphosphatase / guanosine-5'-triphosphate,3'-diphosphate pyrophosphatase